MEQLRLQVENVTKRFPGVTALDDVSLDVRPGEVHALVGENGAGKSTLLKIIFGALPADGGRLWINGQPVSISDPADAMRLGISFIPQEVVVFNTVSVAENLAAGREPRLGLKPLLDWKKTLADAEGLLGQVGLKVSPRTEAGKLSVAQKQLVLIARSLAMSCCLMLMDEPTSSLTPRETEHLFAVIEGLRKKGLSVVYVSHKLGEVFRVADRITVLRDGKRIVTSNKADIQMPQVVNYMVGRDLSMEYPQKRERASLKPVLEVKNATRRGSFEGINLSVNGGEIVGLFGLIGSGRTEFARAVFGRDPLDSGEIQVCGQRVYVDSPDDAMKLGLGLVPEGRKEQGIFAVRPVRENISVCILSRLSWVTLVSRRREEQAAQRFIDELSVHTPSQEQMVGNLSGGNQQKVILARWLAAESQLLILDEPTAGIDVGSKAEIHRLVAEMARSGKAILYISSELPEVLGISDRIVVFHEGNLVGEFDGRSATEQGVMQAIMAREVASQAAPVAA